MIRLAWTSLASLLVLVLGGCGENGVSSGPIGPPDPVVPPPGMVHIAAAGESFSMGSEDGEDNERPVRTVTFSCGFFIDTTEITQRHYDSLMGSNPSKFDDSPDNPVEIVTWFDAVLFCNERSKSRNLDTVYSYTGKGFLTDINVGVLYGLHIDMNVDGYRLPTEAEWEYSVRAGTSTVFYWGDTVDTAYCWFDQNSGGTTQAVATRKPNAFGLYDMSGNVREWCNDWFGAYSTGPVSDPSGADSGVLRVLRGGSWNAHDWAQRSANRYAEMPEYRGKAVGFRTVLPAKSE